MKKIGKITFLSFVLISLLISLTGCQNENNTDINKKIETEISYLDTELSELLNLANGISFKNYKVNAEKVTQKQNEESSMKQKSSTSGDSSQSNSSMQSESTSGGEADSDENQNENYMNYNMEANNILSNERKTDWEKLKKDIEILYSSWSTIILDLYKVNTNSQDILNFTNELDNAIQAIKKEDKKATLAAISKLYSYLPNYSSILPDNMTQTNILKTKSNIYNACILIENNNLEEVKKEMANAEQSFMPIINDINSDSNNQSSINKAYILLKELESSATQKESDVFYIKYKYLMEELNVLQGA